MKQLLAMHFLATALFPCMAGAVYSQVTVDVPGTAQIFLADQPDGTQFGADVVPTNSPIAVEIVDFDPSLPLGFMVSGATAQHPAFPLRAADGTQEYHLLGPYSNLDVSGIYAPLMSLVGVFFDRDQVVSPPPYLSFGPGQQSFAELAPEIQQLFYIGDGRRGRGTGNYQEFHIPEGADVLYLGLFDAPNNNNIGQLQVTIASVPEPHAAVLMSITALATCAGRWCRPARNVERHE